MVDVINTVIQYFVAHSLAQFAAVATICAGIVFAANAERKWPDASIVHIHADGSETSFGKRQVSLKIKADDEFPTASQTYRIVSVFQGRHTGHLTVTGKAQLGTNRVGQPTV
jgi:hypothetical protein